MSYWLVVAGGKVVGCSPRPIEVAQGECIEWPDKIESTILTDEEGNATVIMADDPRLTCDLDQLKVWRINQVRKQTEQYIYSDQFPEIRMPLWRQANWERFRQLHERVLNHEMLKGLDEDNYRRFPDPGETPEGCYADALLALKWIWDCADVGNFLGIAISQMTDRDEILAATLELPPWPLAPKAR